MRNNGCIGKLEAGTDDGKRSRGDEEIAEV
jgi:hypothetical protein